MFIHEQKTSKLTHSLRLHHHLDELLVIDLTVTIDVWSSENEVILELAKKKKKKGGGERGEFRATERRIKVTSFANHLVDLNNTQKSCTI